MRERRRVVGAGKLPNFNQSGLEARTTKHNKFKHLLPSRPKNTYLKGTRIS
jgi:hypothetical protein